MWVAVAFAAVALTGTAFMLWFLVALLRENAPSTCYLVVPIRREPERESRKVPGVSYVDDDSLAAGPDAREYSFELLEKEGDAKESVSGLIALNLRFIHDRVGWRSIHKRGDVFREYGL
jgi:hypothetical protein